jgi:hypothetical protein
MSTTRTGRLRRQGPHELCHPFALPRQDEALIPVWNSEGHGATHRPDLLLQYMAAEHDD